MSFFSTSIPGGYITDLMLPPPTENQTTQDIATLGINTALNILHDLIPWIRLNPLTTNCIEIPASHPSAVDVDTLCQAFLIDTTASNALSPFKHFEITDKLSLGLGYTRDLVFHSAVRTTTTGMEGVTAPGSGVTIHGRFDIQRSPDNPAVLHLIETSETRCNFVLGLYIRATMGKSHQAIHANFKDEWMLRMKTNVLSDAT